MEACSALDHYVVAPLAKAERCLYNFDPVGLAGHCIVGAHSTARLVPAGHSDYTADRLLLLGLRASDSAGLTHSSVGLGEVVALAVDPLSLAHTKVLDSVLVCSDKVPMFVDGVKGEVVQGIVAMVVGCSGPGNIDEVVRVGLCERIDGSTLMLPRKAKDDRMKESAAIHHASVSALVE